MKGSIASIVLFGCAVILISGNQAALAESEANGGENLRNSKESRKKITVGKLLEKIMSPSKRIRRGVSTSKDDKSRPICPDWQEGAEAEPSSMCYPSEIEPIDVEPWPQVPRPLPV